MVFVQENSMKTQSQNEKKNPIHFTFVFQWSISYEQPKKKENMAQASGYART